MNFSVAQVALAGVLFLLGVGFYGLLISRNMIKLVVALQILAKGAMLGLVLAGRASGQIAVGQSLAITVIVADTIVAVIALALVIQARRCFGTLDIKALTNLRR